ECAAARRRVARADDVGDMSALIGDKHSEPESLGRNDAFRGGDKSVEEELPAIVQDRLEGGALEGPAIGRQGHARNDYRCWKRREAEPAIEADVRAQGKLKRVQQNGGRSLALLIQSGGTEQLEERSAAARRRVARQFKSGGMTEMRQESP